MDISHEIFMQRCLDLAKNGSGYVAPNPLVGSVLVHEGRIIGEGWHQKYGEAHAEVNCLNSVKAEDRHLISNSTLYVNLEPCSHFGKTPPCADLIIENKIPTIVIATKDDNPLVGGKGISKLKEAGLEVIEGVLEAEARELNKFFFTFHRKNRPFITLKWAQTIDSFFTGNEKKQVWISNELTQRYTHQLRASHQAILVGTHTALIDNPALDVRLVEGKNPTRILIDRNLTVPKTHHIFNDTAQVIIINEKKNEQIGHIQYLKIPFDNDLILTLINELKILNINSLLIEGGVFTLNKFIEQNCWDEAYVYIGNMDLIDGIKAPVLPLKPFTETNLGDNKLLFYRNQS